MDSRNLSTMSKTTDIAGKKDTPSNAAPLDNTTDTTPATAAHSPAISRKRAKHLARAAKAALHNAKQSLEESKKSRHKTRYAVAQFPILRLPAELRNNVYSKAIESAKRCALKGFRIPPILQVCQQIRAETIGLPTIVNSIDLAVRTNYVVVSKDNVPNVNSYYHHDIGVLQINSERSTWFSAPEVVFRDVRIVAKCACCQAGASLGTFLIALVNGAYTVQSLVWYIPNREKLEKVFAGIEVAVTKVLKAAEARPGFAGLKLSDLQNIARCFHWIEVIDLDDD